MNGGKLTAGVGVGLEVTAAGAGVREVMVTLREPQSLNGLVMLSQQLLRLLYQPELWRRSHTLGFPCVKNQITNPTMRMRMTLITMPATAPPLNMRGLGGLSTRDH